MNILEETKKIQESDAQREKKNRSKRLAFLSKILVWILLFFVVFYFCTDIIFGHVLKHSIETLSNNTYQFEYERFRYNIFTNKVVFKNIEFKPVSDTLKTVKNIHIEDIQLKGFSFYRFFVKDEIFFSDLTIKGTSAHLNSSKNFKTLFHRNDSVTNVSDTLHHQFSDYVGAFFKERSKKFGIEKFNFLNGSVYVTNTSYPTQNFSVKDFSLKVDAIFLNDSILQNIDSIFFFKNFEFNFGKNQWVLSQDSASFNLGFDTLFYSSIAKSTVSENIVLQNVSKNGFIDFSASHLAITHLDFEQILNEKKISPDTLKIVDADIRLKIIAQKNRTAPSGFEKTIQKILPIHLKHLAFENNYVNFQYITANQPDVNINAFIDFYIDDFQLDKEIFKTQKEHFLYSDYAIHFHKAQANRENMFDVSFNDFRWGTKDKDLIIDDIRFYNHSDKGLNFIELEKIQLNDFDFSNLIDDKLLISKSLYLQNGLLGMKSGRKERAEEHDKFIFHFPGNQYVNHISIEQIEIKDVSLQNKDFRNNTIFEIQDINFNVNRFNMMCGKNYSLLEKAFYKKINGGTGATNIHLNDRIHVITWNFLRTDFEHFIRFSDFSVQTNSDIDKIVKEMVILPPTLIQVQTDILEIKEFNYVMFLKYGLINSQSLYAKNADIHIYNTEFSTAHYQKNKPQIKSVNIESILFENSNFSIENSESHLTVNDFLVNVDILNIPEFQGENTILKFNDIDFLYKKLQFKNQNLSLSSNDLKYNHLKEIFEVENATIVSHHPEKAMEKMCVDLNHLNINRFDLTTLIYNKVFYANEVIVDSVKIDGIYNLQAAKNIAKTKKTFLNQLLIRNTKIPNIQVNVTVQDEQEKYYFSCHQSDIQAQFVNWMPKMKGFPHKGKMKVNIRNLVGTDNKQLKKATIDSIEFSLIPDFITINGVSYHDLGANEILSSAEFKKFNIVEPDMDELFKTGKLSSDELQIDDGEIVINLNSFKKDTSDVVKKTKNSQKSDSTMNNIRDIVYDLFHQVAFNDIRLKLMQDNDLHTVSINEGILNDDKGSIINIGALNFKTDNNLSEAGCNGIILNTKQQQIIVDSVYYTPNVEKDAWANLFGYQKDWTKMSAESIIVEGINFDDFLNHTHHIPLVRINRMKVDDYRDKRLPFPENHFPMMPQDMIKKVPRPFLIDTMVISSSEFTYEEQVKEAKFPGSITFTDAQIVAANITNSPDYNSKPMNIDGTLMLMDSAKLTAHLSFTLDDTINYFTASAKLEPFEMPMLNPTLENLAFLTIKEGYCNGLKMDFHGNKTYSLGDMQFIYRNFKIGLIDKKKLRPDAGSNFLSFLANTFIVKHANPTAIFPRNGIIYFERDPHKSIFNYLFKSSLMGIKHTIGLRESKAVKDKQSEIYLDYEHQRKEIIKNYKLKKKAERKAVNKGNFFDFLWLKN